MWSPYNGTRAVSAGRSTLWRTALRRNDVAVIVVGVDGSPGSRNALAWAVDEARVRGSAVTAVHAWPGVSELVARSTEAHRREGLAQQLLDRIVGELPDPGVEVRRVLCPGSPGSCLVDESAEAELVVVGRRGLGGFAGLLLGSTSHQVLAHAQCPVAVVPSQLPDPGTAVTRVVAGVDGSEPAARALRWAEAEARMRQAPMVAVHAFATPYFVGPLGMEPAATVDVADLRPAAHAALDEMVREALGGTDVPVDRVVVEGPAAQALLGATTPSDLLVVGSRGRGGFAGLLLGSVSQQLAEHADCVVVVVRGQ